MRLVLNLAKVRLLAIAYPYLYISTKSVVSCQRETTTDDVHDVRSISRKRTELWINRPRKIRKIKRERERERERERRRERGGDIGLQSPFHKDLLSVVCKRAVAVNNATDAKRGRRPRQNTTRARARTQEVGRSGGTFPFSLPVRGENARALTFVQLLATIQPETLALFCVQNEFRTVTIGKWLRTLLRSPLPPLNPWTPSSFSVVATERARCVTLSLHKGLTSRQSG